MSTDLLTPSTALTGSPAHRSGSSVASPAEKTAAITRVAYLERDIFDDVGHVRRGLTSEAVEQVVAQINELRFALGWLEINLDGRWRWPA